MKTVVFSHPAAKQFDALPPDVQDAAMNALSTYAIAGRGDVKKLQGSGLLRLRFGRYRAIFTEDTMTVLTIYVGKRETTTYR